MAKKISKTVAKKTAKKVTKTSKPVAKPKAKLTGMRKQVDTSAKQALQEKTEEPGKGALKAPAPRSVSGGGALATPAPHGVVRARAGTGKTFTEIIGVAYMFGDRVLPEGNGYTWRGPKGQSAGQFVQEPLTLWGKVGMEMARIPGTSEFKRDANGKFPKIVPSIQQQEVWDFMAKSKPQTICYCAFNNSIVEDFAERYEWLVKALSSLGITLSFSTIHSLGNAACRRHYKLRPYTGVDKGDYKITDWLSAKWQVDLREVWKEKADTINAIKELLRLCKLTLTDPTADGLTGLADHYGVLLDINREEVFGLVQELLLFCREVPRDGTGKIGFNDMVWLPVVEGLEVDRYDLLLIDESQDLNRCQQELVLKAGRRIIVVGDERQAIYGFAGADTDSIDRMTKMLRGQRHVEEMRLTETRRCGRAIVAEANRFVEDFTAHHKNGEGKVTRISEDSLDWGGNQVGASSMGELKEGGQAAPVEEATGQGTGYTLGEDDFVLCRVNAPLVRLAFKMLRAGKRVNIQGRDIGEGLKAFIKKSKVKDSAGEDGMSAVTLFLDWLERFQQTEVERLQRRRNPDADALVTLQDKCECLRSLCEGAFTLKDVYKAIDALFKGKVCPRCNKSFDEKQRHCWDCEDANRRKIKLVKPAGTICSSVHRAKGLEAKRVFILRPDLMPHPRAKSEWEKGQEANLQYVAITRAIEELVYVTKMEGNEE